MANSINQSSNQEVIISLYLAHAGILYNKKRWELREYGKEIKGREREEDEEMQKRRERQSWIQR